MDYLLIVYHIYWYILQSFLTQEHAFFHALDFVDSLPHHTPPPTEYSNARWLASILAFKHTLLSFSSAERRQATASFEKRSDDSACLQCNRTGSGARTSRWNSVGATAQSVGPGRMDRCVEREELGMGRTVGQGQGIAEHAGAQWRRILVSELSQTLDL